MSQAAYMLKYPGPRIKHRLSLFAARPVHNPELFGLTHSLFSTASQAHLSKMISRPNRAQSVDFQPILLTLHQLDFHYHFSQPTSIQAKMQLLCDLKYFKIMNSEARLGLAPA